VTSTCSCIYKTSISQEKLNPFQSSWPLSWRLTLIRTFGDFIPKHPQNANRVYFFSDSGEDQSKKYLTNDAALGVTLVTPAPSGEESSIDAGPVNVQFSKVGRA